MGRLKLATTMRLFKYIFLLIPFISAAQEGTGHFGKVNINNGKIVPTQRLYVNGASYLNGTLQLPTFTNGFLTVNGSGVVGVTAGTLMPSAGANNTVLTSNGTVASWNLLLNANISTSAAIAVSKLAAGTANTVLTTNGTTNSFQSITNAFISASANIDASKLGTGIVSTTEFNTLDGISKLYNFETSFATGAIPYFDGTKLAQSPQLYWTQSLQKLYAKTILSDTIFTIVNGVQRKISTDTYRYFNKVENNGDYSLFSALLPDVGTPVAMNVMRMTPGGDFGFGGTPARKLDVFGTGRFSGALTLNAYTGYLIANGTSAITASSTIPNTAITGTANATAYYNGSGVLSGTNTFTWDGTRMGIGSSGALGVGVYVSQPMGATTLGQGLYINSPANDAITTDARLIEANANTSSGTSVTNLSNFRASRGTFSGSVTNHYGFHVDNTLTSGTNNYGFYSNISNATGRYNFYANGTAPNYFGGAVGIGGNIGLPTYLPSVNLNIDKNITGATSSMSVSNTGQIQSDVTSSGSYYATTSSTQAASFTLNNLYHYTAFQGTFGAGSAVTNQIAFRAASTLTGAANNYGFYSDISTGGTNRWSFYSNGTAPSYSLGNVGIGSGKTAPAYAVDVNGTVAANRFQNQGSTPSIAAGAGAGTGPTVSIIGRDNGFKITITTGTTPVGSNAIVATVTYAGGAYPNGSIPTCTAGVSGGTSNAALLNGTSMVATDGTTTTMILYSGTVALTAATTYVFNCHSGGY